jgi:cyclophilin family peptidyl-prolyl cis-trans isomerase
VTRARLARAVIVVAAVLRLAGLVVSAQDDIEGPVLVVETAKGTFTIEMYPEEAPLSVAHVVGLVRRGFYDGQRIHRAVAGVLVQFGDPQSRDVSRREAWGHGEAASSGQPIGVAEITGRRTHRLGAVALAHPGNPALADSQIYVTLSDRPEFDGHYAVVGRVVSGEDVPARLQVGDIIRRVTVRR